MNVLNFAEEFTRLVIRYTKAPLSNSNSSENASLTNYEIRNAIDNVLATILQTSESDGDNLSLNIPADAIAVTSPASPIVPKINQERNNESECRSVSTVRNHHDTLLQTNGEASGSLEVLQDGKKFISRSSPAIYVNSIGRSDTFTREEKNQKTTEQDISDDVFTQSEMSECFLRSLNEVRESAMNVVTKLDNLKKKALPQLKRMRLSSYNGISDLERTSSTIRAMVPKMRRSITAFPGTPTSSRLLSIGKTDVLDRRKSFGVPCGTSRKNESTTVGHSSTLNLSMCSKVSPNAIFKPVKNPKYAHVQSTIPKPIKQVNKRKAQ